MKLSKNILYIFLFLNACVTPYEVTTNFQEQLIVDGLISDQPGPYSVKISKTVPINNQLDLTNWVVGATVIIHDDLGNSETLTENSPGNYYTKTFQGKVGQSYWVTISTSDGTEYQSKLEKLTPVGDFSNLRYEFVQNDDARYYDEQIHSTNGFNIYLDSDILPEQEGLVRWRWTGTYQILTYPSLKTRPVATRSGTTFVPDPLPCSGYIFYNNALIQISDCTCCDCWITRYNDGPIISNPKFINDNKIRNLNVAFIEANVRTFYNKYVIDIEQLSVSQAVYDFWKIVSVQKQNGSTLFQTPAPKTSTNLTTTSPNAMPVIGYFAASSVKKHSLTITRADVPYRVWPIDTLTMSCTQAYKNSTTKRPLFW